MMMAARWDRSPVRRKIFMAAAEAAAQPGAGERRWRAQRAPSDVNKVKFQKECAPALTGHKISVEAFMKILEKG